MLPFMGHKKHVKHCFCGMKLKVTFNGLPVNCYCMSTKLHPEHSFSTVKHGVVMV